MSIALINPYYRGIGEVVVSPDPGFVFSGVLVNLSADDSSATTAVNWNVEAYDVGDWHDGSTNTDRLTVPSGVELVEVAASGDNRAAANFRIEVFLDGASLGSSGGIRQLVKSGLAASGYTIGGVSSGPHPVTAGQYFTVAYTPASGSNLDFGAFTWFSACALDPDTRYVRLRRTTDYAVTAGSTAVVSWEAEDADVGGWSDLGVSATNVVVPSGVDWVVAEFGWRASSLVTATRQILAEVHKNSATVAARDVEGVGTSGTTVHAVSVSTGLMAVTSGDVISAHTFASAAETFSASDSSFTVREVLGVLGACKATKGSSTQTLTAGVPVAVVLEAEEFDTDGAHDNSTNPSRITVPSGYTRARAWFAVRFQSTTARTRAWVAVNGSARVGCPAYGNATAGQNYLAGAGAWIDVSPGDYFELFVEANSTPTVNNDSQTFLCVQFG